MDDMVLLETHELVKRYSGRTVVDKISIGGCSDTISRGLTKIDRDTIRFLMAQCG